MSKASTAVNEIDEKYQEMAIRWVNELHLDYGIFLRINESQHECTVINRMLGLWDRGEQKVRSDAKPFPPINLDAETTDDDAIVSVEYGIPHFVAQTKLSAEAGDMQPPQEVKLAKPEEADVASVLDKLQSRLPSREEVRRGLGFGPLDLPVPQPVAFSVIRKSGRLQEEQEEEEKPSVFSIRQTTEHENAHLIRQGKHSSTCSIKVQLVSPRSSRGTVTPALSRGSSSRGSSRKFHRLEAPRLSDALR